MMMAHCRQSWFCAMHFNARDVNGEHDESHWKFLPKAEVCLWCYWTDSTLLGQLLCHLFSEPVVIAQLLLLLAELNALLKNNSGTTVYLYLACQATILFIYHGDGQQCAEISLATRRLGVLNIVSLC